MMHFNDARLNLRDHLLGDPVQSAHMIWLDYLWLIGQWVHHSEVVVVVMVVRRHHGVL